MLPSSTVSSLIVAKESRESTLTIQVDKLRHKVIEGVNSTERVGVDCVGGGGLCGRGWGWTVWVGVDCVGGATDMLAFV